MLVVPDYEALPPGYNFDYISDRALLELVTVKDGTSGR